MPANDKRVVNVQKRSGFDKHYRNTLTADVGTLVPNLFDEVIPDTKVNLKINVAASMPPLVSETYMNVRLRVEAFAVPERLLSKNFEAFFNDFPQTYVEMYSSSSVFTEVNSYLPFIKLDSVNKELVSAEDYARYQYMKDYIGAGSLLDYLGYDVKLTVGGNFYGYIPTAPLVCYHLIWQEWYRNPRVQWPAFAPCNEVNRLESTNGMFPAFAYLPYEYLAPNVASQVNPIVNGLDDDNLFQGTLYDCADGVSAFSLRQRNFGLDYFTAAMIEPQQGSSAVVKFGQNGDPNDGFTIASLRAMNSIQQFRERNNLTAPRFQQQIYARYGTAPSDGVIQRPILIGAATYDVYSNGVLQNSPTDESGSSPKNPFLGNLGARAGQGYASGSDFIIENFHAKEPMYIMVLASLVPEVSYSQNMNPIWKRYYGAGSISDMANGILQNVGPQAIETKDIVLNGGDTTVFAYTDRYSDWMFKNNEVHGKFKHGQNLEHFVLQRYFTEVPQFGTEFLEIPKTFLDDVLSVSSATMGFGYWLDTIMEYSVSQPLQEYAIPSLQDPGYEHGRSIVLRKNGQLL